MITREFCEYCQERTWHIDGFCEICGRPTWWNEKDEEKGKYDLEDKMMKERDSE
jgi:hypothetical protein